VIRLDTGPRSLIISGWSNQFAIAVDAAERITFDAVEDSDVVGLPY
jgi:hypothetical protein